MHLGAWAKCHSNLFTGKPSALSSQLVCFSVKPTAVCHSPVPSNIPCQSAVCCILWGEEMCKDTVSREKKQILRRVTLLPVTTTKLSDWQVKQDNRQIKHEYHCDSSNGFVNSTAHIHFRCKTHTAVLNYSPITRCMPPFLQFTTARKSTRQRYCLCPRPHIAVYP